VVAVLTFLFCLALCGVVAGVRMAEVPNLSRRIVPFSGGLLIGIAFFWIFPEIAEHYGPVNGGAGVVAGFGVLWLVDRFFYQVCPTCSHDHSGLQPLHGFAAPLLTASAVHSFFDGWSLAVAQQQSSERLKAAFLIGIGIHKIPEGLALGVLLLAATGSVWKGVSSAAAVQACMFVGAGMAVVLANHLGHAWGTGFLSLSAGIFLYLGYHAIEGEYRSDRPVTALMPALTGAAGAAALRLLPGI
jgi:zinc transporter ZupT